MSAAVLVAIAVAAMLSALSASAGATTRATAAGALPTVKVALTGKAVVIPTSVPAGATSLSVTTTGEKDGNLGLVRLDPGVTVAQAFARVSAAHGDPNALIGYASVVADIDTPTGAATAETVLAPGNYAAVDFSHNGAKPPLALFTVTASSQSTALPAAAATIKMEDFRFVGPSTLHDGELVRFENDGYVTHMTIGVKFSSVANARKAMALLKAGNDRAAGKLATGAVTFTGTASPGVMQQQPITAKPGVYVLACFMATEDGREHTTLGMLKMVKITK